MRGRRVLIMKCLLGLVLLSLTANASFSRTTEQFQEQATDIGDIVSYMMPYGVPTEIMMPPDSEKDRTIQRLKAEQAKATGNRAQQTAFLLAILGSDYSRNCNFLVHSLQGCDSRPNHDCDENTIALVIGLYERGNKKLLQPILKLAPNSDGAVSEILGSFYADTLIRSTSEFIDGVRSLSPLFQREVCTLAGGRDGGGMSSEELSDVRNKLHMSNSETAKRCLSEIEMINKTLEKDSPFIR
jgi:hypothetical protein